MLAAVALPVTVVVATVWLHSVDMFAALPIGIPVVDAGTHDPGEVVHISVLETVTFTSYLSEPGGLVMGN